jgi:dihydrofolate reductase
MDAVFRNACRSGDAPGDDKVRALALLERGERIMSTIVSHMTMSLDGFIADPDDGIGELFDWYSTEQVELPAADVGAIVAGRHLFDIARGWGDHHPVGAPVVVVTHRPPENAADFPRTSFVDGLDAALDRAREVAGDREVTIASADIAQQAIAAGRVDEIAVSLVPVLFGTGKRYFGDLADGHVLLDDPVVVAGRRALHLRYAVRR